VPSTYIVCLYRENGPDDITIVVGEYDLSLRGDEEEYLRLDDIFVHEKFNEENFEYDFAILKLQKPVKITSKVGI